MRQQTNDQGSLPGMDSANSNPIEPTWIAPLHHVEVSGHAPEEHCPK